MSDERDAVLDAMFGAAEQDLPAEEFTVSVMAGVNARRRRLVAGRLSVAVLLILLELLLDSPLQNSVGFVTSTLATNLFELEGEWLSFVLSPVNSVAGLLGLLLLGLSVLYRRL